MDLIFIDYEIKESSIRLHFHLSDPGPGEETEKYIEITDAELSALTTVQQFSNFVKTRLARKIKAEGIANKLDQFKGKSVTI